MAHPRITPLRCGIWFFPVTLLQHACVTAKLARLCSIPEHVLEPGRYRPTSSRVVHPRTIRPTSGVTGSDTYVTAQPNVHDIVRFGLNQHGFVLLGFRPEKASLHIEKYLSLIWHFLGSPLFNVGFGSSLPPSSSTPMSLSDSLASAAF